MAEYTELIKALRYCMAKEDGITICEPCPYYGKGIECENVLHTDAAAAIEELQAKNKKLHGRIEDEELKIDFLTADNTNYEIAIDELKAQLPKRGEWYEELFDGDKKYQCSNCLTHWDVETRYCPFCGAKMEGERKEGEG